MPNLDDESLEEAGDPRLAIDAALARLRSDPGNIAAFHRLAAALRQLGRTREAEEAEFEAVRWAANNPILIQARLAIAEGRLGDAERALRDHLAATPDDAAALMVLGSIPVRRGLLAEAEDTLHHVLEIVPNFPEAKLLLASLLVQQNRMLEAISVLDDVLLREPANADAGIRKAMALAQIGDYQPALLTYETLLKRVPEDLRIWLGFGHLLNTVGRPTESAAVYRHILEREPMATPAWWALANLRSVKLAAGDIAAMRACLRSSRINGAARAELHFALGKALEEDREFEESFEHYRQGNWIRSSGAAYNELQVHDRVERSISVFSARFFEARGVQGSEARDPIFIIGMPRAGSTLVEQILASHSMIEGTSELPNLSVIVQKLVAEESRGENLPYPDLLAKFQAQDFKRLGEEYLSQARVYRKTNQPYFTDKMPSNWMHIGLIHMMLPNAKIIDARRNPLDCCFSNFSHNFEAGHEFTFSLDWMAGYYREYLKLLSHFENLLPGRVHRVEHERLVDRPEAEIRRLFDYLELPFEESVLRFHENRRPVSTPSAGQVRRPINRLGIGRWAPYGRWLQPLVAALGPAAES